MVKLYERVYPVPLKSKRNELLNISVASPREDRETARTHRRPPEPIIQINEHHCAVNHNAVAPRNLFMIPWILGLLLTAYWHVESFYGEWVASERTINEYIESTKSGFGENFFEKTTDPTELKMFHSVNKNGKMSFKKYLNERYYNFVGGMRTLYTDIFLVFLYVVVLPGLIYWAIRYPKYAPLYFDRDKRVVYTWRKGRLMAQWYDDIRILENISALTFVLRGDRKDGMLSWYHIKIQPHGNPIFNTVESYQPILACIAQFMEYGKDHVWPGNAYHYEPNFYFFKDKKPDNFSAKLDALLAKIRRTDDEPPLDEQGNPIPIDLKALKARKIAEMNQHQ